MTDSPRDYGIPHDEFRPGQLEAMMIARDVKAGGVIALELPTGCHAKGQGILMYNGSVRHVEDIQVGDQLMGPDGQPREVTRLIHGFGPMVAVCPRHGKRQGRAFRKFVVSADHILTLLYLADPVQVIDVPVHEYAKWTRARREQFALYKVDPSRLEPKCISTTKFYLRQVGLHSHYYGFTLTGDGRYLLDDFTVTHNSGKTSLASGVAAVQKTTALMRTIALVDQYKDGYGFDAVYGRDQYPCEFLPGYQADSCVFSDSMRDCPDIASCQYYIAREIVKASTKRSVSYAYYLHARWIKDDPGKLFCDEAHVLEDEILSHVSLEISEKQRAAWGLPEFPGANGISEWANEQVIDWARRALGAIPGKDKVPVRMHGARDRLMNKLRQICTQIEFGAWYVQSSSTEGTSLSARPLSPGPFAGFLRKTDGTILLSATIGDAQVMADEFNLGYLYKKSFPHVIPKAQRPVYLIKSAPAMGHGATELAFTQQAALIARAINQWPKDFRGVIHVSRWSETELLAKRLTSLGLGDRVWTPPHVGTRLQVEAFLADPRPGLIAIAPDWRTGLDFSGDKARIAIVAKVPFAPWTDPYIRARAMRPDIGQRWYRAKAALDVVQACGRVVRGPDDFGVSYIVDSSWGKVAKYAPDWFEPEIIW